MQNFVQEASEQLIKGLTDAVDGIQQERRIESKLRTLAAGLFSHPQSNSTEFHPDSQTFAH